MKKLYVAAVMMALGACASPNMDDPMFKAGYDAGCAQAHASLQAREASLIGQPELFRRGFSAGYTSCGGGREFER
jgi:hypothetical protein